MKKIVREYTFSPEQLNNAESLARKMGIMDITSKILCARGVDTEEKMRLFLHPSKENFLSPYLMKGMKEAVELITRARDEEWRVAVYGDYDADGIGACAIMYRALKKFGIEPYLYVPERAEGYGMSTDALDKIFDEFLPDLFITVDCGISNAKEVEYIKEQGAYVIVTDHHELPDVIPDTIVINPKLEDDYPYDNLCGAGVAFKLSEALIGKEAHALLDFAALSTVADSVPLLGENRDIVAEGVKLIERNPRPSFTALLGKSTNEISAQTLAFTIAPRINAAGRMGDAKSALDLFTTDDETEIFELATKLCAYNLERQKSCDELYREAHEMLEKKGAFGNVIMLSGDWNSGFVGIVAARLAEEYSRPTLLFVRRGEMLKGSARSIDGVNIFEALKACSGHIDEFGGHAQAAGVNVKTSEFDALEEALNDYIGTHYSREDFVPKIYVSEEIDRDLPIRLARELNRLEPYGVGNRKPLFLYKAKETNVRPIKPASPHLAVTAGKTEFMYFSGEKDLKLLESDLDKGLVFECNLSKFRGKESLKGFIRTVVYDGKSGKRVRALQLENTLSALKTECSPEVKLLGVEALDALLKERIEACAYGLCAVAYDRRTLEKYPALSGISVDVFNLSSTGTGNAVLISPEPDCKLTGYRMVVYLDTPPNYLPTADGVELYASNELSGYRVFEQLQVEREDLLTVFATVRRHVGESFACLTDCAKVVAREAQIPESQAIFGLLVFEELGIISFEEDKLKLERGKKTELALSKIYSGVRRLTEV